MIAETAERVVDVMEGEQVDSDQAHLEQDASQGSYSFPQGLAGFPDDQNFAIIYPGYGDCICLQSLDNLDAAFVLTPWDQQRLGLPPSLSPDEIRLLKLRPGDVPIWMLVLNPFVDSDWVTANLRAPIVINEDARIALQLIRVDEYEIRFPWIRQRKPAPADDADADGGGVADVE
ncbi:MAG: flagellar assembly protein FliW [Mariprofundales bacterium]|nr:flagellar assembly protein FliW [Mariprofundales bacterium]